jgi:hypothetical protein
MSPDEAIRGEPRQRAAIEAFAKRAGAVYPGRWSRDKGYCIALAFRLMKHKRRPENCPYCSVCSAGIHKSNWG